MYRISPISEDWVDKGCHLHVGKVEVALRPDHKSDLERNIVYRKVFSKTNDDDLEAARKEIEQALDNDLKFRNKLKDTLERAMEYLMGVEGEKRHRARGRLFEFKKLVVVLERMETI